MTFLFLIMTVMGVGSAWAVVEYHDYDGDGVDETYNVVYLNLSSGNNSRDGSTVGNAVKTWAVAYSKLPAYTGTTDADRDAAWDHNIIVVCDIQTSGSLFIDETISGNRPATITGVWPWTAENTTAAKVKAGGGVYLNATAHNNTLASGTTRIGADTKFKYIRFCGQNSFFSMYLHDCMFDVGCVMDDIKTDLTTANGAIAGRKAPDLQVFLFANAYNFTVNSSSKPDGGWPQQTKPVTLTIRSGKFGRILSNRIIGTSNDQIKQRYVIGNPDHPLMCVVNVDIDAATTGSAWNTKGFKDDIAFLCAGMTQGAEYCDVEFNIRRGTIATLVGAMQGNSITNTPSVNLSNSSFFGRTKVTINPDNDADVVIQRYFAGCFGRETGGQTGISNAAFYGQSILNMYGGTIESGAYVSAGGISGLKSADGAHHTTDKYIPYVDASANKYYPYMGITYKTYDANMSMPKVTTTLHGSSEEIDLEKTKTEFNIYGGIIKGGLYGGSYGFSPEMPTERTMAGAGSLWGETNVSIYGGTITGGVYGGGMGDPTYYNTAANDRKADFLTVASVYGDTHVNIYGGTINGDIYGAGKGIPYQAEHIETQTIIGSSTYKNYTCPENEFLDIAKVYGNTNVLIDPRMSGDFDTPNPSWTFTGNIYGGGALGSVEGNTNVIIKGGVITGNIFGAGEGESGHPNKAKVEGTDNIVTVNIENGAIRENVYGGGNLAVAKANPTINISGGAISENVYGGGFGAPAVLTGNPTINVTAGTVSKDVYGGGALADVDGLTTVNIISGTVGNAYGGGLGQLADAETGNEAIAATVTGNANVTVSGGITTNVFGCNNLNGSPEGNVTVTIKEAANVTNVYGGGNQAAASVSPVVNINGGTSDKVYGGGYGATAVLTGSPTVNVSGGTVSHDVYGGGALANVTGTPTVNVSSGTVTHDVYGGGALADVNGNTTVNLTGGAVGSAYGGALGSAEVAAKVNGDTYVHLDGSKVTETGIFGANNLNGTPTGHVKVHVTRTTPRDGQTSGQYDVAAVYGGGNLAAYVPSDATLADNDKNFAEVLIENCDNSIEYVYGGGNAAPVPATKVTIVGANAIDNAFAGGNGAGADNPGADIGYKGYFSSGAATEYGTGIATINVRGGKIHHVYGGSNTLGYIRDHAVVNVEAEGSCTMDVAELYGGGNKAPGKAAQINITCTGETGKIDNVYGGAHMADLTGDIELNIRGGNIGNAFGGNNVSGTIDGTITVNVDWATGPEACGTNSLTNVYGGGNLAPYTTPVGKVGPTVNLKNGTVSNNVYGGGYGEAAVVTGNPIVNLIGGTVTNDIFGGGDAAPVTGNPLINANYGTVKDIFAGGRGATAVVTGSPKAYINKTDDKELTVVDVYGGGDAANVIGTANVQVDKGMVKDVYGGGNAADVTNTDVIINGGEATMAFAGGHGDKTAEPQTEANVTGYAHLTIHGGTVAKAFAGSNSKGTITGKQLVTIVKDANSLAELHVTEVYGGGNQADGKAGTFDIGCTGSDSEGIGDLFGGAREANITGDVAFTIEGGKIDRIFGGNNVSGNVAGSIQVNIAEDKEKYDCGLNVGYVYGGGQDAAYKPTTPGAYPEVNIIGGNIAHDVFGGGLGATAIVTSNPVVNIQGGTIGDNVFGGGSLAKTDGDPTVNVTDGTVTHDVYGGGALADVTGNTSVNLTGGAVGGAYGGALGQKNGVNGATSDIAAYVNGNTTVTLNGTQITETGVFGCNNLNGTPKGHAYVHVLSTTPRDGEDYDVPAVYGGGNLSAYVPDDDNDFAEVLIEGCDNSINYVYGGGNAAPVPATSVTIYGANAINNAFAGGNGYGADNPGADVGYNGYYSKTGAETPTYGTGETDIKIYGGTINNVYGGSNTLGYIRTHAYVEVLNVPDDHEGTVCDLRLGEVHAGGNEAEMYCGGSVTLACSEGAEVVYAGSSDADIHGNIDLVITSGTYGKVFGGNNHSGNVYGGITINIDETGCWPVMIGELYACGNEAPYSVYGYYNDDDDDVNDDNRGKPRTSGSNKYADPVINLISFTRIGKVFGGGYAAAVYGSPVINVEPIPGIYATGESKPNYVLDGSDGRTVNTGNSSVANALGADKIGSIGTIYGGGNKGAVYGNTNVLIGTKTTNKHVSGSDKTTEHEVAVTITGNVFGGGNEAIVSGDTNVKIGENN